MNTKNYSLNYWLGKLNKLQLFGYGIRPLVIKDQTGKTYRIGPIEANEDEVVIHIA